MCTDDALIRDLRKKKQRSEKGRKAKELSGLISVAVLKIYVDSLDLLQTPHVQSRILQVFAQKRAGNRSHAIRNNFLQEERGQIT